MTKRSDMGAMTVMDVVTTIRLIGGRYVPLIKLLGAIALIAEVAAFYYRARMQTIVTFADVQTALVYVIAVTLLVYDEAQRRLR